MYQNSNQLAKERLPLSTRPQKYVMRPTTSLLQELEVDFLWRRAKLLWQYFTKISTEFCDNVLPKFQQIFSTLITIPFRPVSTYCSAPPVPPSKAPARGCGWPHPPPRVLPNPTAPDAGVCAQPPGTWAARALTKLYVWSSDDCVLNWAKCTHLGGKIYIFPKFRWFL